LVIATQRPTTNIITGVIKANFPTRIAFRVTSMMDSRTILDTPGANQLIGRGDMLISAGNDLIRLQCAFIDTPEIDRINEFIGSQRGYPSAHFLPEYVEENANDFQEVDLRKKDEMFEDAARLVVQYQQGSTSLLQRKFSIGYNRAGRIIDQLEAAGVVGPFEGSKARQVLIHDEVSLEQLLSSINRD
jgi:DNA segregation ATPase FtsK/SpoIIIE, S-DNA-T family